MKKLLIVLLALTVVGVFVVAQDAPASISLGGFGRAWYAPVASDGSDSIVSVGPNWGGTGGNCAVGFNGNSENAGFSWNPRITGGDTIIPAADQAKIWVKINPMFTVQVGMIQGDVLRGKIGDFGDILSTGGEDDLFQRFNPTKGIMLDVTPMDGVYLGAAMDLPAADAVTAQYLAKEAYKMLQLGAGYKIPDIGHFRVQYIGEAAPGSYGAYAPSADLIAAEVAFDADPTDLVAAAAYAAALAAEYGGKVLNPKQSGAIQAAFAYTGMEGLLVDFGFKFPMESDDQMKASVAANYGKDALSTGGRVDTTFGGKEADKLTLRAAAKLWYTVQAPISVGIEVAYNGMSNYDADYDMKTIDVFPAVQFGYSNGLLKVGFDYKAGLDDQDPQYYLPIMVQYSF